MKKKKEEEPRVPIRIVPTRRLEDEQIREMQYSLDQVNEAVRELREYSESIKIRADEATIDYVNQYAEKVGATIKKMKKSLTAEFRERYDNEFILINNTIKAAREAGEDGRLGRSVHLLVEATDQVKTLRKVAALEAQLHTSNVLENVEIEGVEREDVRPVVYSALEAAVLDVGTENAARSRYMLRVGTLLAENRDLYSIDDPLVRQEASAAATSLVERADQAEKGLAYSPALEAQDNKSIEKSKTNLTLIAKQFRQMNIDIFKGWRKDLGTLAEMQTNDQVREHVRNLMRQLNDAIKKLEKGQTLSHSEITRLTTTYLMTTGREMPKSREEKFDELDAVAAQLRGKRKKVKADTSQWYGQLALNAINEEQRNRAALAITLGIIQQAAMELNRNAQDYLSNYQEMRDIITKKRDPSPAMLSMFSTQLEAASMLIEAEKYEAVRKGKAAPKRARIKKAAAVARERLANGDGEGSRRLLNMLAYYMDQLEQNKWKSWEGAELIEQALDEEIKGKDGSKAFDSGLVFYNVSEELDNFNRATRDWGRGMALQKKAIEQMFAYARKAAKRGNVEDAGKALTMLGMYVDSAERLAERRGTAVLKVADENTAYLSGMKSAMESMAAGKSGYEDTFTESFKLSQTAYVGGEADRLENLARRREIGQETVLKTLTAARRRAEDGNFVGANTLLQSVRDYYGESQGEIKRKGVVIQKARKEGWRYALLTRPYEEEPRMGIRPYKGVPRGYTQGGEQILQAMTLEMKAKTHDEHFAAAQLFDQGTRRMANTELLLADYRRLRDVYHGKESLAPGVKAGTLPLGTTKEDGTMEVQREIDLETIRSYEAENTDDTVTTRGRARPLAERFEELREAALNGQAGRFGRLNTRFWNRLSIVTTRADRRRAVTEARGMLRQGQQSLEDSYRIYVTQVYADGNYDEGEKIWAQIREQVTRERVPSYETEERVMPTTGRRVRVQVVVGPTLKEMHDALVGMYGEKEGPEFRRMQGLVQYSGYMGEMLNEMKGLEDSEADINFHHISPFLEFAQKESRTALAYDFVSQQLSMFKEYKHVLGGRVATAARIHFDEAIPRLEKAREFLAQGKLKEAEKIFREAVYWQTGALANYDAVNASSPFTESGREAYATGLRIIGRLIKGERIEDLEAPDWSRYNHYNNLQETIFTNILKGEGTRRELETAMNGARVIEVSVFGTPADEASQSLTTYVDDQKEIRSLVQAGKIEQANARLAELQETVSDWRLLGQVGLTAAGIAAMLCGHPHIGGALFVTMGIDNLITEYRMTGTTSAMSWIMLGGIVASMGLAGWAGALRTSALAAEGAGATARAAQLARLATGLNYANMGIGVGFSAYMGYHAIDAFSDGRNKEGLFLTFLAAFPWAHRYGPKVPGIMRAKISRLRGRVGARAQLESVVEEVRVPEMAESQFEMEPSKAASRTAAERYRSPEGLFDLLKRLRSGDVKVRTNAEGELNALPKEMITVINNLKTAKIGNITHVELRGALEKGEMSGHARGLLEEAISQMELGPRPEPTPPRGPRGGVPVPRGEVDASGLLANPARFLRALGNLIEPVPAETAAARQTVVNRSADAMMVERIRASSPEAARIIDRLIEDPLVRDYIRSLRPGEVTNLEAAARARAVIAEAVEGHTDPTTGKHVPGLRELTNPKTAEAESAQQEVYLRQVVGGEVFAVREQPPSLRAIRGGAVPEIRAMAEGEGGPPGGAPEVRPGAVETAGEGAAPRAPSAPAQRPPPQEVIQRGLGERTVRGAGRLAKRAFDWGRNRLRRSDELAAERAKDTELSADAAEAQKQVQMRGLRHLTEKMNDIAPESTRQASMAEWNAKAQRFQNLAEEIAAGSTPKNELATRAREMGLKDIAGQIERGVPANEVAQKVGTIAGRARALTARLEQQLETGRMAQRNLADVYKTLYHQIDLGGEGAPAAMRSLIRIHSRANVRAALYEQAIAEEAAGNPTLRTALDTMNSYIEAAATTSGGAEAFMRQRAAEPTAEQIKQGAVSDEVMLDFEAIVETVARNALRRGVDPVEAVQDTLGIEYTTGETAVRLEILRGKGLVIADELLSLRGAAQARAGEIIDGLKVGRDPLLREVQAGLKNETIRGGDLENMLVEVLRSEKVAEAAGKTIGKTEQGVKNATKMFRDAAAKAQPKEGKKDVTVEDVLKELKEGVGGDSLNILERFVKSIRGNAELASQFKAIEASQTGAGEADIIMSQRIDIYGKEGRSIKTQVKDAAKRAWHWTRDHEPFWHQGGKQWYLRTFKEVETLPDGNMVIRPRPRATRLRASVGDGNWKKPIRQGIAWGLVGGTGWGIWRGIEEVFSDAESIEEARGTTERKYGIRIGEENARWLISEGLDARTEAYKDVEGTFKELHEGILESSGTMWPLEDEVADVIDRVRARDLSRLVVETREKVLSMMGGREFTDRHRKQVREVFDGMRAEIDTLFSRGDVTGGMSGEIEEKIESAQEEVLETMEEMFEELGKERGDGGQFFNYIGNTFPKGPERRPKRLEDWERTAAKGMVYDIRRTDEIFSDGREMSEQLDSINNLLEERRGGDAKAQAELAKIVKPWGITVAQVDELLNREKKKGLDITDMIDLRRPQWVEKGLAVTYMDLAVESFLADSGLITNEEMKTGKITGATRRTAVEKYRKFLNPPYQYQETEEQKKDRRHCNHMTIFLWWAVDTGHIPSVYIDDALKNMSSGNTMQNLRKEIVEVEGLIAGLRRGTADEQAAARERLQQKLRPLGLNLRDVSGLRGTELTQMAYGIVLGNHLKEQNMYIQVERERQVGGVQQTALSPMRYESFLGMLDHNAVENPSLRKPLENILKKYRNNNDALLAFDNFRLQRLDADSKTGNITKGDTVYGNPEELADFIIELDTLEKTRTNMELPEEERNAAAKRLRELGALTSMRVSATRTVEAFDPVSAALRKGYVSTAVMAQLDPALLDAENRELVEFVYSRSQVTRQRAGRRGEESYETQYKAGIVKWMVDDRVRAGTQGHVVDILREISRSDSMCPKTSEGVEQWLKENEDYFRGMGFWRPDVPTWTDLKQRERTGGARGRRKGTIKREPTTREMMGEELVPRPVRRRGVETTRVIEGEVEEEAGAEAEAAAVQLSAEAHAFWVDWMDDERTVPGPAGGLNSRLSGAIDRMLEDERDKTALQGIYGEDIADKESEARRRAETDIREHLYKFFKDASDLNTEKPDTKSRNRRRLSGIIISVVEGAVRAERTGSASAVRNFLRQETMRMVKAREGETRGE